MNQTSPIILKTLEELLPRSVLNDIACFTFYDKHPRDKRTIDITICSNRGVVQEFFKKELIDSILIENVTKVEEIKLLRNSKCDIFYLVAVKNELIILSKKENLQFHKRIYNVHTYDLNDLDCKGYASLQIISIDDAVPLVLDENFDELRERSLTIENVNSNECLITVSNIMRKLTEAKYSTKCNDNTLKEYVQLRQMAAFAMYQRTETNIDNSVFKLNQSEISSALQVTTKSLKVKCCNKKIIIISSLFNTNKVPISDISVLLHGTNKQSLTYTTKIFNEIPVSPYWEEVNSQIGSNKFSTIVAVVDLKEIRNNTMSSIDFDTVVSFKREEKSYLLPLGTIGISALDIMGDNFDILSNEEEERNTLMLALLSTSERINLCLRHIKNPDDNDNMVTPSEIFCTYLKMESLGTDNVVIHKRSPHHILYGVMVIFEENVVSSFNVMNIQVYSRSHWQVLALVHYLYDAVPYKIIATTQDYKLTAIIKDLTKYNEMSEVTETHLNYTECASSLLKQTHLLEEYLNNCIINTIQSKSTDIKNKVDLDIDLLAQGLPKYMEFRDRILEESLNGVKSLSFNIKPVYIDSDIIISDD
ncbi:unnamed protein product [Euphydryas editha]|uniref:Uncharacterized protein n=1 Tax=Euphydryas editha TaxID=104508 RepID=A0AAU9TUI0_EUPED|nr:unnamed protein product [Euphydryas editha]